MALRGWAARGQRRTAFRSPAPTSAPAHTHSRGPAAMQKAAWTGRPESPWTTRPPRSPSPSPSALPQHRWELSRKREG